MNTGDIQKLPFGSWLVRKLQGRPISEVAPATNQVLQWDGSNWTPKTISPGVVTPKFIGARIQATSTQSVSDSSNTDLVYQSVLFDTDTMANLGSDNRILTVNTPGIYLVICQTSWAPNGTGRRINVALHNGYYSVGGIPDVDSQSDNRNAVFTPIAAGTGHTSNVSIGIYQAIAGDFFASGAFQGSGAALNANGFANCFLSAVLVGS